jgi:hypothetical protein
MGKKCRKPEEEEQAWGRSYLACQVCGRSMKGADCSWQEDDDGKIICRECRAEWESCGCSD